MRILHLALKDLRQIAQDKKSALFLLLLPVLFTWVMGLVFSQNSSEDLRLPVGLVDEDGGALVAPLQTLLDGAETVRPVRLTAQPIENLEEQVCSEMLVAVIVIPAGFSAETLAGKNPQLTLLIDRASLPGQTADRAIQLAATRLLGAVQAAQLSAEAYGNFSSVDEKKSFLMDALALAVEAWQNPRLEISSQAAGLAQPGAKYDGFAQASSGMLVFFATFGMVIAGYVLLTERRSHTLARMLTTTLSRAEIIAGHTLAMFTISFAQTLLLTIFGQLIIGVNYWHNPAALLLALGALALFSASLGLLISAVARNENEVVLLALGSTLILGLMGGAFFPLDLTGKSFAMLGHLLPSAWAIDALQNITLRGLGLDAVILPSTILLGYALLIFSLAVWRFRFERG